MTTRAVCYARTSKDDRRNEGRNLDGQLEMCRDYARSQGWRVVSELAEDDRGASGIDLDLPQLNVVREMARNGEFDILVCREIDRLSRSLAKQLIVEEELKSFGVEIAYVLGEYADTPEGNLMKHVKAAVAEYERLKITERLERGRRQVAKAGAVLLHGDRPPYGYRLSNDGKSLVLDQEQARIIRLIFTWYTEGDGSGKPIGTRAIARKLTRMQVPTWVDIHGGYKKSDQNTWASGTISTLLRSETYKGQWYYGRSNRGKGSQCQNPRSHWISVDVPAIIDQDTWEMAQVRRERNKEMARRNSKYSYLLGRRITCGHCGHKAHGRSAHANGKIYLYYSCAAKNNGIVGIKCDIPDFRAAQVDGVAWDWIRSFLTDPRALKEGLTAYRTEQDRSNRPRLERLAVIDNLISENRNQLGRLIDLYVTGSFPKEALLDRQVRLEKVVADLEKEKANLQAQLQENTLTEEQILDLQSFAARVSGSLAQADNDFTVRRSVIEELDARATILVEHDQKVVYVTCTVGDATLPIVPATPCSRSPRTRGAAPDGLAPEYGHRSAVPGIDPL